MKKGLYDLKLLAPVTVKDRSILGFPNTVQSSIAYFEAASTADVLVQWVPGMIVLLI